MRRFAASHEQRFPVDKSGGGYAIGSERAYDRDNSAPARTLDGGVQLAPAGGGLADLRCNIADRPVGGLGLGFEIGQPASPSNYSDALGTLIGR